MADVPPEEAQSQGLTELLHEASNGNVEALNRLFPLVYDGLRRIAARRLRPEREGHTLSTTALVHEAYLKLVDQTRVQWQSRAHFYAVASHAMRRILITYGKRHRAGKRGGGRVHVELEEAGVVVTDDRLDELLALDQALERLKRFNPRGADVVVYRFFGGLSHDEIAEVMGTSGVTVRRVWGAARDWLHRELRESPIRSPSPHAADGEA